MREILALHLRRLTEILPCSSDLSPSQQSSSSGDLLPEMMESGTPPPAVSPSEAGDPEVSSRRVSLNPAGAEDSYVAPRGSPRPAFERGHGTSPAPSGARPEELKVLLGRASISEEHRALMGMVIERISSAKSGLRVAVESLLTGFEVHWIMYTFVSCA